MHLEAFLRVAVKSTAIKVLATILVMLALEPTCSAQEVGSITVTDGGSGYALGTFGVSFTGGCTTEPAAGVPILGGGGAVTSIPLATHGSGCASLPTVVITSGLPSNASLGLSATTNNTFITITSGGAGFSGASGVSFGLAGCTTAPTGTLILSGGSVKGIDVTGTGLGCTSVPTLTFTGPGAGAAATVSLQGTGATADVLLTCKRFPKGGGVGSVFGQNGVLHLTKDCTNQRGNPGDYCVITSSNVPQIPVGSKLFYDQAVGPGGFVDSNVLLSVGIGDLAVGRCTLDLSTGLGLCNFSDGVGRLAGFRAPRAKVAHLSGYNFRVDGLYSLGEQCGE